MKGWYDHAGRLLTAINGVLHPHGFEAIVKEDCAAFREMLRRARSERRS